MYLNPLHVMANSPARVRYLVAFPCRNELMALTSATVSWPTAFASLSLTRYFVGILIPQSGTQAARTRPTREAQFASTLNATAAFRRCSASAEHKSPCRCGCVWRCGTAD
jgi:hypothetical protein